MPSFLKVFKAWLPLAFLITVLAALSYTGVQQAYRMMANDPQIQMAEDAATAAGQSGIFPSMDTVGTVSIGRSLAPYLVFYDIAGTPTGGNGLLNGELPHLPRGVFDYTRTAGEDRVTWQPASGIREAIVIVRVDGATPGFVLAGRSLRETEVREGNLEIFTDAAWIMALVGTLILKAFAMWEFKGKKKSA